MKEIITDVVKEKTLNIPIINPKTVKFPLNLQTTKMKLG